MKHLRRPDALAPESALCIGAFDGLHRGHRALLQLAADHRDHIAILTFEPHPALVLAPERAPPRLQSSSQRVRVARALGVHTLAEVPFDLEVAALDAATFVQRYLIAGLAPATVIVGEDFRFGRNAAGDTAVLGELLSAAGIDLQVVTQLDDSTGHKVGSSEIRGHLIAGEIELANDLLGYRYAVSGTVVHGAKRGRQLGFPTANIAAESLAPRAGVYAGWLTTHLDGDKLAPARPAVANIGTNPTFAGASEITTGVEVHAIGAQLGESLYDCEVEFAFVCRLRDEIRFDGAEALRTAIEHDVILATQCLRDEDPKHRRPARVEPN